MENILPVIAAGYNVIKATLNLDPKLPRHMPEMITGALQYRRIADPTPGFLGAIFNSRGRITNRTARNLGNTQAGDGYRYRGRGYVQITGRGNYARFSNIIPNFSAVDSSGTTISTNDLETYPMAAGFSDIAAVIAAEGLRNDLFTQRGRTIGSVINMGTQAEFLNARNFIGARYVTVGRGRNRRRVDVGMKIANRATDYLNAMRGNCF